MVHFLETVTLDLYLVKSLLLKLLFFLGPFFFNVHISAPLLPQAVLLSISVLYQLRSSFCRTLPLTYSYRPLQGLTLCLKKRGGEGFGKYQRNNESGTIVSERCEIINKYNKIQVHKIQVTGTQRPQEFK